MASIPRVPRHAVDRPSLRARLDVGVTAPLTLVVAPPGAGKTVLLSQWARTRPEGSVVWLDITDADADAGHFARRVVVALADIDARMAEIPIPLATPGGGLGDPFMDAVTSELRVLGETVVILDDLHTIAGSAVAADLERMIDRMPPDVHVIFSSRIDPPIALRRTTGSVVELRQAHLAFTDDVTADVIERIIASKVTPTTAAAVTEYTEGWAAGVQLTALSLRFRDDPDRFTEDLGATDRLILDYLTEEVFEALTPQRREALMRLSVLDAMCAGLVEEVADIDDGRGLLRELERESMFLVPDPHPDRRGWYRFHHLFRDALCYRLRAYHPDDEPSALETAARWHLRRGELEIGVEYFVRARAWADVCRIALDSGRETYERLRTTQLARWLSMVPEEVRWSDPRVELLYGLVVGMSGRGAHTVEIMQRLLAADALDIGGRQVALAYAATCVYFVPHPATFLELGRRALAMLADQPSARPPDLLGLTSREMLESVSWVAVARAQLLLGDLPAARAAAEAALAGEGSAYGPYRVQILGTLALVEAWAGRLDRATALAGSALELAQDLSLLAHPAPADAHLACAFVAIQRGEPAAGTSTLHEGSIRAASNQRTQLMWIAHLAAQLIDPRGTESAVIESAGPPPPAVAGALAAREWRQARAAGMPRDPGPRPETTWSALAFEQVAALLERGAVDDARALLERTSSVPDSTLPAAAVERQVAWAWLEHAEGRVAAAHRRLSDALELAESEGLAQPVLAAGPTVLAMVKALSGPPSDFRRRLAQAAASIDAKSTLPHPLTARELELLSYLPTRLTSPDIAARWFVSVNTIKTHLAHLYRKLDVADRDAAIARARELGLLSEGNIPRTG